MKGSTTPKQDLSKAEKQLETASTKQSSKSATVPKQNPLDTYIDDYFFDESY